MRIVRTVTEMRSALKGDRQMGALIGLVPTMGGLHAGHLSLLHRARAECDAVVASLFVNPTQFEDGRDLEAYPRDEDRDAGLAAEHGVDYLFAPTIQELYPEGFSTMVSVAGFTDTLEGAHRGRSHFDGVVTVVAKLLNIVAPGVAYFGQKDAQQALVIRRLMEDLNFPVRVAVSPTVREPDGLAMSSRNVRLAVRDRHRAAALYRALQAIQEAVDGGERDPAVARAVGLAVLNSVSIEPEYLELVAADTMAPVEDLDRQVLAVVAARVGTTRLIDNLMLRPRAAGKAPSDTPVASAADTQTAVAAGGGAAGTQTSNAPAGAGSGAVESQKQPAPAGAGSGAVESQKQPAPAGAGPRAAENGSS
jgi:pantoate--beta-alanine ligase